MAELLQGGGAIHLWNDGATAASLTLAYSTIVGNTANNVPEMEDGVGEVPTCVTPFATTTAAANIQIECGGAFASFATVIAKPLGANGPTNCASVDGGPLSATSSGYNYADDTSCGFTQASDSQSTANDPLLNPLGNWGGPTLTMLPKTPLHGGVTSPLIDAIPVAACQTGPGVGVTTDQRGVTRPQIVGCDIGAVEVLLSELQVAANQATPVVLTPRFTG